MPKTVETTVFEFSELSPKAKEKARDWARQFCCDHEWYEYIFADFLEIAKKLDIETSPDQIEFSGFSSQGDGARFAGQWNHIGPHPTTYAEAIFGYAPQDDELNRIAKALDRIQHRYRGKVFADITKKQSRYCHEFCTDIDVQLLDCDDTVSVETDQEVIALMRDLMKWLYRQLNDEYDRLNGDESINDMIESNAYTFTESGVRFG